MTSYFVVGAEKFTKVRSSEEEELIKHLLICLFIYLLVWKFMPFSTSFWP